MSRKRWDFSAILILAVVLSGAVAGPPPPHSSGYTFSQIAKLDDNPFHSYLEPGMINSRGDVLFAPDLNTGGEAVVLWRKGQLATIAQAGETMPGGGVMGGTLSPIGMNDSGDVAFAITRDGWASPFPYPYLINAGIYRYSARDGLVPVLVPGQTGYGLSLFWAPTTA
jgi:hypothetical protein